MNATWLTHKIFYAIRLVLITCANRIRHTLCILPKKTVFFPTLANLNCINEWTKEKNGLKQWISRGNIQFHALRLTEFHFVYTLSSCVCIRQCNIVHLKKKLCHCMHLLQKYTDSAKKTYFFHFNSVKWNLDFQKFTKFD